MLVMNSLTKQEKSHLNQQALQAARDYSQKVAWPTVILAIVVFVGYWALPLLVIFNNLSLLIAIPLMAVLTYASYTVLHEAVHYCISGNIKSLRWLNDAMGYLAATVLLTPLIAHRCEHLKHHRNANDGSNDPDQYSAEIVTSVKLMLKSCWIGIAGQFTTYMADRWDNAPASQNRILIIEVLVALAMRVLPFALLFAFGDAANPGALGGGSGGIGAWQLCRHLCLDLSVCLYCPPAPHSHRALSQYINYSCARQAFPFAYSTLGLSKLSRHPPSVSLGAFLPIPPPF